MPIRHHAASSFVLVLAAVVGLPALSGCGGSAASPAAASGESVTASILSLSDVAYGSQKAFANVFVEGNAPKNRGDYAMLDIKITGEPKISGDTATVPVTLKSLGAVEAENGMSSSGAIAKGSSVKTTWTLKKVGKDWKIAKAPLK